MSSSPIRSCRRRRTARATVSPTVVPSRSASRFSSWWVAWSIRTLVLCMLISIQDCMHRGKGVDTTRRPRSLNRPRVIGHPQPPSNRQAAPIRHAARSEPAPSDCIRAAGCSPSRSVNKEMVRSQRRHHPEELEPVEDSSKDVGRSTFVTRKGQASSRVSGPTRPNEVQHSRR